MAFSKMSPEKAASNVLRELRACHTAPTPTDARVMLDTFFDYCGVRYSAAEVAEIERRVLTGVQSAIAA